MFIVSDILGRLITRWDAVVCSITAACMLYTTSLAAQQTDAEAKATKQKIAFIEKSLVEGEENARRWWGFWIAAYMTLSTGQFVLSGVASNYRDNVAGEANKTTFPRREQWVNYLVGGTKSMLPLGWLLVLPFTPAYASGTLAQMPDKSEEDISKKLAEAETLLEKCANKEKMGRAWWKHLMGISVNAAGSVIIWQYQKGKDPWKDAIISFFTGIAVFETSIWTQPTRAIEDWQQYNSQFRAGYKASYSDRYETKWSLIAQPGGLALRMSFF